MLSSCRNIQMGCNVAPIPMECDAPYLRVKGDLPRELRGTLIRNGSNPQFERRGAHWFFGDGMLHAFHIENGRVSYRNRWVRTPKWLAENEAGRALFGAYNQKLPRVPASVTRDGGVANTSVIFHSGRLLALEEAHPPTEIDLATLGTRGYCTFGEAITGPFTAHPKVDPLTGELLFFSYNANGPMTASMSCGTIDPSGNVTKIEYFRAPYAAMVHDFIVTATHVAVPILPLCGNIWRAVRGGEPYVWDPSKGSHVGVMKRSGTARDMIWFEGEPCFVFHVMNAWDEAGRIVALVMQSEEPPLFPHLDGSPTHPEKCRARLARWTFDLASNSNTFKQEYLDDVVGELPRIDERRQGLFSDHGWYATMDPDLPLMGGLSGLMHVDSRGAQRAHYRLPGHDTVSEPIFVPRSETAAEGDGWLLAVIWRAAENRSDLAVFEAGELAAGPIALVQLGHRVPDGFHGTWVPADGRS